MPNAQPAARRGRIDAIDNLRTFDVVEFNGSNPFPNDFALGGFQRGAEYYRGVVRRWGFENLGTIADIAAGFGRWSVFLAEVNDFVCGYERNEAGLDLARKLSAHFGLDNTRFEVADVTALKSAGGQYDGAWCFNTMQFVDRAKTLSGIHRILKPGGLLHLGVHNAAGRVLEKFFAGYRKGGLTHNTTRFALRGLKEGPFYHGKGNYASAEHSEEILGQFGFKLSPEHEIEVELSPKAPDSNRYAEELRDLPALARRLESDDKFAAEFAEHPELAFVHPVNVHLTAVRI